MTASKQTAKVTPEKARPMLKGEFSPSGGVELWLDSSDEAIDEILDKTLPWDDDDDEEDMEPLNDIENRQTTVKGKRHKNIDCDTDSNLTEETPSTVGNNSQEDATGKTVFFQLEFPWYSDVDEAENNDDGDSNSDTKSCSKKDLLASKRRQRQRCKIPAVWATIIFGMLSILIIILLANVLEAGKNISQSVGQAQPQTMNTTSAPETLEGVIDSIDEVAASPTSTSQTVLQTLSPTNAPTLSTSSSTGRKIIVSIFFDEYSEEIGWSIVETESNVIIDSVPMGAYPPGLTQTKHSLWLLPDVQYTFTMEDSAGDGLCCGDKPGNFTVFYNDGSIAIPLLFGEGNWGVSVIEEFSVW